MLDYDFLEKKKEVDLPCQLLIYLSSIIYMSIRWIYFAPIFRKLKCAQYFPIVDQLRKKIFFEKNI